MRNDQARTIWEDTRNVLGSQEKARSGLLFRRRFFLVDRNVATLSGQLPLRKFRIEIEKMRDDLFLIAVEADAVGRLDGCIE